MSIRLGSTVINCADIELMTSFWSQALDLVPASQAQGDGFRLLRGEHGHLSLQLSRTPVTARDQMHLDLYTDDQAAEVERLAGLGATFVRHNRDPEDDYVVMTDPEGNEFCVCAVADLPGTGPLSAASAAAWRYSGPRIIHCARLRTHLDHPVQAAAAVNRAGPIAAEGRGSLCWWEKPPR
jgi:Glyoxalase-like domain